MWQDHFNETARWYATLSLQPGWIAHCRHAVAELEAMEHGHWKGLAAEVRKLRSQGLERPGAVQPADRPRS